MRTDSTRFLYATATYLGLSLAAPLAADTLQCSDPLFEASGEDVNVLDQTCRAASDARKKLANCGVVLDRLITIEVSDFVESEAGECFGVYHCGEDRIEVLAPDAMSAVRDRKGVFASLSDETYWQSVIAHELTHAAYDTPSCPHSSCVATSEYASYAMQVWTLPDNERVQFGGEIKLKIEPAPDAINTFILFMAPERFALITWRHFQAQDAPCTYMKSIMEGQVYFDTGPL